MKHSAIHFLMRSMVCVVLLLLALGRVSSQTPAVALLELKSCGRTLTVFDDRTLVETFAGNQTQRELSEKQMRKLRKVIATDPCGRQLAARARNPEQAKPWSLTQQDRDACFSSVLGYGPGLLEIFVTRHSPDLYRDIVVYVPCGNEKIRSHNRKNINAKWKRFIYEVTDALGGKSFIEACQCRQVN